MQIEIFNLQKKVIFDHPIQSVRKIVRRFAIKQAVKFAHVSISLVGPRMMCHAHEQYFGDPSITDCISIPIDEITEDDENCGGARYLGEILVCPAYGLIMQEERGLDPYRETTLYIIHGLLHLLGHDDTEKLAKQRMRRAEASMMKILEEENLLLRPRHVVPRSPKKKV